MGLLQKKHLQLVLLLLFPFLSRADSLNGSQKKEPAVGSLMTLPKNEESRSHKATLPKIYRKFKMVKDGKEYDVHIAIPSSLSEGEHGHLDWMQSVAEPYETALSATAARATLLPSPQTSPSTTVHLQTIREQALLDLETATATAKDKVEQMYEAREHWLMEHYAKAGIFDNDEKGKMREILLTETQDTKTKPTALILITKRGSLKDIHFTMTVKYLGPGELAAYETRFEGMPGGDYRLERPSQPEIESNPITTWLPGNKETQTAPLKFLQTDLEGDWSGWAEVKAVASVHDADRSLLADGIAIAEANKLLTNSPHESEVSLTKPRMDFRHSPEGNLEPRGFPFIHNPAVSHVDKDSQFRLIGHVTLDYAQPHDPKAAGQRLKGFYEDTWGLKDVKIRPMPVMPGIDNHIAVGKRRDLVKNLLKRQLEAKKSGLADTTLTLEEGTLILPNLQQKTPSISVENHLQAPTFQLTAEPGYQTIPFGLEDSKQRLSNLSGKPADCGLLVTILKRASKNSDPLQNALLLR